MNEHIQKYIENGFTKVHGWVHDPLPQIMSHLDEAVTDKSGGVAEIGIHHGRFYLLLNCLVEQDRSWAIDVFADQHLNVDNSGGGDLQIFKNNLSLYDRHKGNNTEIICGDSTDAKLNLVDTIGRGTVKYFSIDGGHTPYHAVNDLRIAEQVLRNDGIVIVDDILHPCWLGVLEGTVEYLKTRSTLVPFSIGCNKLFMCKISYKGYYYQHMTKYRWRNISHAKFFGHDIVPIHI